MTTEREMLSFAAKACGIEAQWDCPERGMMVLSSSCCDTDSWNPLTNSADCAAMCAKLDIDWLNTPGAVTCVFDMPNKARRNSYAALKDHNNDREAAWRYSATMVAAKIGGMK